MSPIVLRPIREQFEHNRMIRLLQTRLRRKYLVDINIEDEREATSVRSGTGLVYPDLVLTSTTGSRRVHGVVEVETVESVSHLEAMAEWVHFGKVRGAFYLYVPAGTTDIARNLCKRHRIAITEIWSYHAVGDQMRFTMTYRSPRAASRAAAARRVTKGTKKTVKGAKRAAKAAKGTTKSGRSATKKAGAKATSATSRTGKKTAKGTTRRVVSGGKVSSRTSTATSRSASKTRSGSTPAGTRKTAAPRRMRKQR